MRIISAFGSLKCSHVELNMFVLNKALITSLTTKLVSVSVCAVI